MVDAIVIGAGIGGLSAAIGMAAAGLSVRVLEASSRVGGKAGVAEIDGVEVDTGPSLLTMPEVFDGLLALAGTSLAEEAPLIPVDPFRYMWPDGTSLDLHRSPEATRASVAATLGAEAAADLEGFLAYAADIWDVARPRFVMGEPPRVMDLVRLGLGGLREASRLDPFSTLSSAIASRVRSPHLRDVLARYATYNGSDPRRAAATLGCIAHLELVEGAHGVTGGIHQLVRALARAAVRLGVRIDLEVEVERIVTGGPAGAVVGVALASGVTLRAPIVVANADVADVARRLLPGAAGRALTPAGEPSTSGWCAVLRASRAPGTARAPHTVLFPRRYLDEFVDLFDRDRPPREPTVYLCAQERAHHVRAWADEEPIFVMVNAPAEPAHGPRDAAVWSELEQVALRRVRDAGLVAAGDRIVWRRTPADLARQFPGSRGAIYGAASNSTATAFRRPPNVVASVPGLFLASGSAHPGGGLPLAALSGRAAARGAVAMMGRATRPMERRA